MIDRFSFEVSPFDRLTAEERRRLQASVDLALFPKDHVILGRGAPLDALHVIVKGQVHERRGGELAAVLGPEEFFDLKALFGGGQTHSFVAAEDTICHLVPLDVLADLARGNPGFGSVLYEDFADKLRTLANATSNREMSALMMARIRQAYLHAPVHVAATDSLRDAAAAMKREDATSVLVRDGDRTGLVTGSDLRNLVILDGRPVTDPVGPLARYELLTLERDDLLLNALVLMTKHNVRRVVITEQGAIVGVLEQIDLLGVLSNHSQIIALQVERATSPDDLRKATHDTIGLIRSLHGTGVRVPLIADLVTELNRKIFRKLYEMLAPPELVANSCLLVMGSEGRGEQLLKTDQDNGLILRDGFEFPGLAELTASFTRHLVEFGYPLCHGNVMVSNPEWTRPLSAYKDSLFHWIHRPDEQAQLNLAIFYDAAAVAGDPALLEEARRYLMSKLLDNQAFFTQFARPALSFETPGGGVFASLFDRRRNEPIDIKKAGIFPLVHGIRALALEKHLTESNTTARIWALADLGVLDRPFAQELADAFAFLSTLRLKAHVDVAGPGTQTDNLVRPQEMTKLDRDQFDDCLGFVKKFKEFIAYHFHLNMH